MSGGAWETEVKGSEVVQKERKKEAKYPHPKGKKTFLGNKHSKGGGTWGFPNC